MKTIPDEFGVYYTTVSRAVQNYDSKKPFFNVILQDLTPVATATAALPKKAKRKAQQQTR